MKVVLCGGGNAVHVLSSYVSANAEVEECSILSLFPGEAERLGQSIPSQGIQCCNDLGPDVFGKPAVVTDDPAKVIPGADVIIFALPSFTHELYLQKLKPHLKRGVTIGAMPGEGGFDLCCIHNLGADFCRGSSLFALETLPWACRIVEYGKKVEVLGTKKEIDIVVSPKEGITQEATIAQLQSLIGREPLLKPAGNFLGVTLMNINSVWHPTISYGFFRNHDITVPFDTPPPFYEGADEFTGDMLGKVSDEVLEIRRVLEQRYPGLDLSSCTHVSEWMLRSYGDDIGDKTSIYTMLHTNKGYRGLTHPMREVQTPEGTKYLPNFKYRYYTEDVPMGLVVTKGIAELAGVKTPNMDAVIDWCQKMIGKEYIVDGKLVGKDVDSSRAPQHYGFQDLDSFMKQNDYVSSIPSH